MGAHEWIQSDTSVAGVYCRRCGRARFDKDGRSTATTCPKAARGAKA